MTTKWLFDVDGTLTPSRGTIHPDFKTFFHDFCKNNHVYLVTGSDKPKTVEQIGADTFNLCKRVYNCSGNEVWEGDVQIKSSDWILPEDMHEWLSIQLTDSPYPKRTGLHFEHRTGMVNFSVVGRNAQHGDRKHYYTWDCVHNERLTIAEKFNRLFGDRVIAKVGGETGLDIFPVGCDKAQVIKDFEPEDDLHFFGDRCDVNGNDYSISVKILDHGGRVYPVTDWQSTFSYLVSSTEKT